MFEQLCVFIFMFIVVLVIVCAFYKGYQSKNHDREMLRKIEVFPEETEADDGLLNSDGRPNM